MDYLGCKSVVYYSHTYYDMNGSFDAENAIFYMPATCRQSSTNWNDLRNVAMARKVTLQRSI